jgi:hypothetical protein
MKIFNVLFWLPFVLWGGCKGEAGKVQDFIPGTYVNQARGAYSVAKDTLLISAEREGHYRLERRTAYQAVREGKLLPERHKVAVYEAVYDPVKLELSAPQSGRVFRFDRDKGVLLIHQAVYRKL